MPDTGIPASSATALREPSDPILPSPRKEKVRRAPPSIAQSRLCASTSAWRVACCAVGGANPPSGAGTSAQSPIAHTPSWPSTASSGVTWTRPRDFATRSSSMRGCGDEGTVEMSVRVGIRVPSARRASVPVAASSRVPSTISTPRSRRIRSAKRPSFSVSSGRMRSCECTRTTRISRGSMDG